MKASNLHDIWSSPDNTRLTSKQYSFRLPTHIAAKIEALCQMFPNKNRTQIVADLLTSALNELEQNLPSALGERVEPGIQDCLEEEAGESLEPHYHLAGRRGAFRRLADRFYEEIEKEQGNESPEPIYGDLVITKSELEKGRP